MSCAFEEADRLEGDIREEQVDLPFLSLSWHQCDVVRLPVRFLQEMG